MCAYCITHDHILDHYIASQDSRSSPARAGGFAHRLGKGCILGYQESKETLSGAGACMLFATAFFILGFLSPLINTIDFVGSAVNSCIESQPGPTLA